MPRKPRITAVPVDAQEEEGLARAWPEEAKTDAEQMTDIINEVKVVDEPDNLLALADEPAVPVEKPKAKRAPRQAKAKVVPQVVEVQPTLEEVTAEVELPSDSAKADAKQSCPDCGKQMTAKTLKYSHSCPAKKQAQPERAPERQTADPAEELMEWQVQRCISSRRAERAARREEMVSKLMQNAF